jgi:hypothetical protein
MVTNPHLEQKSPGAPLTISGQHVCLMIATTVCLCLYHPQQLNLILRVHCRHQIVVSDTSPFPYVQLVN